MGDYSEELLFLFDIDGTLLSTGGSGYRSFVGSCREILGLEEPIDGIHMAGRIDRSIFQLIVESFRPALANGDTEPYWRRFRSRYLELLELESRAPRGWRLMPGVSPLLEFCAARGKMALLTGNVLEGARIKLATLGIDHFFPTGGFGEKNITRAALAAEALEESRRHYGLNFAPERTFVIGDTTHDIQAGQFIGARVIAVATGTVDAEELRAAGATLLVPDFAQGAEEVRRFIAG